jgi:tryptophanyl-tRNA synthetase
MPRRLTGFTPSGELHLGNYVGAIRPILAGQGRAPDAASGAGARDTGVSDTGVSDTVVFISDLHALTLDHDPRQVRRRTLEFAALLLAAGADPDRCLFLVQSHVPEHAELHYLLECVAGYGEAQRMIQFKEKARRQEQVRVSLLTYPILMAADILLYDTDEVPVGEDQRQHVELARDIASRFNARYGQAFTVPRAVNPPVAARIMDLTTPNAKMSKSASSAAGALRLLDEPDVLRRKVMRAVTDTGGDVVYDVEGRPGVSNLLDILAACTERQPARLASEFHRYSDLKQATADAVIATLAPVRERYLDISAKPEYIREALRAGAARAREYAGEKLKAAKSALGLLPV